MGSLTLLQLLLMFTAASVSSSQRIHIGASISFNPKGKNSDGRYEVYFRYKPTGYDSHTYSRSCHYGDCGSVTYGHVETIAQNSYGLTWHQTEEVRRRELNSNLPFDITYPYFGHFWYIPTFWIQNPKRPRVNWRMLTHVDLGTRSDTGESNHSPITDMLPMIRVTQKCPRTFNLAVFDPDGDRVRCRLHTYTRGFANHETCSLCGLDPAFSLDQNSCTLTYRYSSINGTHPIEFVVEDYPNKEIKLFYSDGSYTRKTPLPVIRRRRDYVYNPTTNTTAEAMNATAPQTTFTTGAVPTTDPPTTITTGAVPTTDLPTTFTTGAVPTTDPPTTITTGAVPTTDLPTSTRTRAVPTTDLSTSTRTRAVPTTDLPTSTRTRVVPTTDPQTTITTRAVPTTDPPTTITTRAVPTTDPPTSTRTRAVPTTDPPTSTRTRAVPTTDLPTSTRTRAVPTTDLPTSTRTRVVPTTDPQTTITTRAVPTTDLPTSTRTRAVPTTDLPTSTRTRAVPTTDLPTSTRTRAVPTTDLPTSTRTRAVPTTDLPTSTRTRAVPTTDPQTTITTRAVPTTDPPTSTRTRAVPTTDLPTSTRTRAVPTTDPQTTTRTGAVQTTDPPTTTQYFRPSGAYLSKIPLDFTIYVDSYDIPSCLDGDYFPLFLSPTPPHGAQLPAFVNRTLEIKVRSVAQYSEIIDLIVTGPQGISKQNVSTDLFVIKWTPTELELNDHIRFCFVSEAKDEQNRVFHSELRCVIVHVDQHEAAVTCNETTITVEVKKTYLTKLNEDKLRLNEFTDSSCDLKRLSNATHLVAVISLNSCGTYVEEDDDNIIYKNAITSADVNEIISRENHEDIALSCVYPKRTSLTLGFTHKNPYVFRERGFGAFTIQFEFFETQNFSRQVSASSYPVQVYFKQMIFMQIEATSSIPNTELFVETCKATPYDNPNSHISYAIIENGCVKDKTVQIYPSSRTQFRFGMEAFEFIGEQDQVYITCSVILCENGVPGTRCSQGCLESNSGNHRSKREAASETSSRFISQGPLSLVKTSEKTAPGLSLNLGTNLVFMVGCLLVCGAIIYRSRRNKTGYQPVSTFDS